MLKTKYYAQITIQFHGNVRSRIRERNGYQAAKEVTKHGNQFGTGWLYGQPKLRDLYYSSAFVSKRQQYTEEERKVRNLEDSRLRNLYGFYQLFQTVLGIGFPGYSLPRVHPTFSTKEFIDLSIRYKTFQSVYFKMREEPDIRMEFDDETQSLRIDIACDDKESGDGFIRFFPKQSPLTAIFDWSVSDTEIAEAA